MIELKAKNKNREEIARLLFKGSDAKDGMRVKLTFPDESYGIYVYRESWDLVNVRKAKGGIDGN